MDLRKPTEVDVLPEHIVQAHSDEYFVRTRPYTAKQLLLETVNNLLSERQNTSVMTLLGEGREVLTLTG